jgi:superfamily II DNA or RNA helicase
MKWCDSMDETMISIGAEDIREAVSHRAFAAALSYLEEGRVRSIKRSPDGATITAKVEGNARKPYRQNIRLHQEPHRLVEIEGICSCPVGFNCKHVAAVLLSVIGYAGTAAGAGAAEAGGQPTLFKLPAALPPAVVSWLQALDSACQADSEDYPSDVPERLHYVLQLVPARGGGLSSLSVAPVVVRLRRDGTLSPKGTPFNPQSLGQPTPPRHLRPADRRILQHLAISAMAEGQYSPFIRTLDGKDGEEALRRILATGRARWIVPEGPMVREGSALPGRIVWRSLDDGSQRPTIAVEEGLTAFRLAPAWYAEEKTGRVGPLEIDCPPILARYFLAAPAIPAAAAAQLRGELARRLPERSDLLPEEFAAPQKLRIRPTPHLRLFLGQIPDAGRWEPLAGKLAGRGMGWRAGSRRPRPEPMARLSFRYGPVLLPSGTTERQPVLRQDRQLFAVERNVAAEVEAADRLTDLGLEPVHEITESHDPAHRSDFALPSLLATPPERFDLHDTNWPELLHRELPALEAEGWSIEIAPDFPIRLAAFEGDPEAELRQGSGIDWFELHLGVTVEGERVDLTEALLALLEIAARGGPEPDLEGTLYLPLKDGQILPFPGRHVRPIFEGLRELFDTGAIETKAGRLTLARLAAADLAELEEKTAAAGLNWRGGEALRELGRRLRQTGAIPAVAVPESFAAILRPYQQRGVDWLQYLGAAELGGVLADDMGLGKTVQTLAHLAIEKASGRADRPSLVVCPTSLVANWKAEAQRFAPGLSVLLLHGKDRKTRFGAIGTCNLAITTYPLLARDRDVLLAQPWHLLVLDEAQTIKNPDALSTGIVRGLQARQRLCLSGTPLENHLGELWSLFAFAVPGLLGERAEFNRRFRVPVEKRNDTERRSLLARRVRPFLLRRGKEEVAPDLPARTEIMESIELDEAQRAIYESVRLAMHEKVRRAIAASGLARSRIIILDALLKLRQACCDPRLLKLEAAAKAKAGSAKLARLMEMIPALIEEGRRILLFSQFTSMLALIEAALRDTGIDHVLLTGDTVDRATPISRFQSGKVPLFLVSLKAGGTGLNLTAADTVILYDPWWNPAVEEQAAARAHRIGQDKPVFIHRLVALGTIEEKIEELKDRKRALVAGILDDAAGDTLAFSEADIEELFAPVPTLDKT